MTALPREVYSQLIDAYGQVAGAFGEDVEPSDAAAFARRFWKWEDDQFFDIGCPDFGDRPALVFGVIGLQALCGVERDDAIMLLQMAIDAIKNRQQTGK
ncbi:MAG: hypothetical protein E6R06_19695 [Mycobacterium sp.]|nr:MAG: hypothetical protein E6R06_19695 [Mycobacterium sp.]